MQAFLTIYLCCFRSRLRPRVICASLILASHWGVTHDGSEDDVDIDEQSLPNESEDVDSTASEFFPSHKSHKIIKWPYLGYSNTREFDEGVEPVGNGVSRIVKRTIDGVEESDDQAIQGGISIYIILRTYRSFK
jgi:hypothetical protein